MQYFNRGQSFFKLLYVATIIITDTITVWRVSKTRAEDTAQVCVKTGSTLSTDQAPCSIDANTNMTKITGTGIIIHFTISTESYCE